MIPTPVANAAAVQTPEQKAPEKIAVIINGDHTNVTGLAHQRNLLNAVNALSEGGYDVYVFSNLAIPEDLKEKVKALEQRPDL